MAMRLHELHPVFAHFPIALLPLSVASDVVGMATDNRFMLGMGRAVMPMAVTSMALTAVTGVIAQEGVTASRRPGVGQDFLTTHRNVNIVVFGAATALSVMRMRQNRPSKVYFGLAAGTLAALTYSAYLGGAMVHEYGVGVEAASGVQRDRSPELKLKNTGSIVGTVFGNLGSGLARAAKSLFRGPRFVAMGGRQGRLSSERFSRQEGEESRYYYSEDVSDFQGREKEHDAAHHRFTDDDYGGLHS